MPQTRVGVVACINQTIYNEIDAKYKIILSLVAENKQLTPNQVYSQLKANLNTINTSICNLCIGIAVLNTPTAWYYPASHEQMGLIRVERTKRMGKIRLT